MCLAVVSVRKMGSVQTHTGESPASSNSVKSSQRVNAWCSAEPETGYVYWQNVMRTHTHTYMRTLRHEATNIFSQPALVHTLALASVHTQRFLFLVLLV